MSKITKITNEVSEKEIVSLYNEVQIAKDILKTLGFPSNTTNKVVYWVLRENCVERRKNYNTIRNTINHDVFEKIDSPSKAYFLGLLIADEVLTLKKKADLTRLSTYMYKDAGELKLDRKYIKLEGYICN